MRHYGMSYYTLRIGGRSIKNHTYVRPLVRQVMKTLKAGETARIVDNKNPEMWVEITRREVRGGTAL